MKLVIQLYTWEIFMFIPVNKYRMWFPGYVYAKCMHILVEYTFRKHFNIFPDQKSIETRRKKYMHARARRRDEEKETKSLDKVRKRGKKWEAGDRIGWTKREERQRARKRAVLHAFAFSLLAAFVPVVFLQLLVFNLYHAIFRPMKFVSSPIYIIWEWRKRSPRNAITSATIFLNEGARADALTNDSRTRVKKKKKKTALLGKRKFIP